MILLVLLQPVVVVQHQHGVVLEEGVADWRGRAGHGCGGRGRGESPGGGGSGQGGSVDWGEWEVGR